MIIFGCWWPRFVIAHMGMCQRVLYLVWFHKAWILARWRVC